VIESKLNKTTWYETVPYLELEEEMSTQWHPEPVMTEEDWKFIKRHIRGRKNIFIREGDKERFVYVDVDLPEEEIDKYRKDREGLKRLLMSKHKIDEMGAEQILRKAGWESDTYHIIPPVHTDVVVNYGSKEAEEERFIESKEESMNYHELASIIRYLGGLELQQLNYYELIYDKVESDVQDILDNIIRTQRRILGKMFGVFYTVDPLMAESILTIRPERMEFLKSLNVRKTVTHKKFHLFNNPVAWNIVKERIVSKLPEVRMEDLENFKGKREEFISYVVEKTGKLKEIVENILDECGWTKTEEIPAFLRQIGP
ncbi:MAG: hypothetical protein ACK4SM_03220, partial [Aquificaceae bacterium]